MSSSEYSSDTDDNNATSTTINNPLGTGFEPKQSNAIDKNFAAFDKGGKLLRMMEKMGYKKGMGIGKNGGGIAVPVEVVVRQSGVGIGFGKYAYYF
jgi:hypothetical protein